MWRIIIVRQVAGYVLAVVGLLGVGWLVLRSFEVLRTTELPANAQAMHERFLYIKLSARAFLATAVLGFALKVLATAERMTLPPWWINPAMGGEDTTVARTGSLVSLLRQVVRSLMPRNRKARQTLERSEQD